MYALDGYFMLSIASYSRIKAMLIGPGVSRETYSATSSTDDYTSDSI